MRLRQDDLLPGAVEKHFEVKPVQTRHGRAKTTVTSIMPQKPAPPLDDTVPLPDMWPCALIELDDGRCHWPLGDVHQVATLFCGGATARWVGAILAAMPLSIQHRHAVVFAGRTHDVGVITTVVSEVLLASPGANLFEIEQVFRDSKSAAYLVATTEGFVVVLSAMAMLVAVSKAGMTVEQNRAALATCRPWPAPPAGSAN